MPVVTDTTRSAYAIAKDDGVADLWWPYGPAIGRYTMKAAAEQSQGRMIQMLVRDGRGAAPPLHIHRDADETFYVIAGTVSVFVGDERMDAGPGDYVFAPMGVPHAFLVTSEYAEMLVTFVGAGTEGPLGAASTASSARWPSPSCRTSSPPRRRFPTRPSSPRAWPSTASTWSGRRRPSERAPAGPARR